jgi:hypothetical protein
LTDREPDLIFYLSALAEELSGSSHGMQTAQGSSPTAEHWSRASIEPLGFGDCLWRRLRRDADPKDVARILDSIHMGGISSGHGVLSRQPYLDSSADRGDGRLRKSDVRLVLG